MKKTKRIISVLLIAVLLVGSFSVCASAAQVSVTDQNYGYIVPTNPKFTKTLSTVHLYGDYDYINFHINSRTNGRFFFYEIYSDSSYTKLVSYDYVYCSEYGFYTYSPCIKLKGIFKSGTYYCVTYSAYMDIDTGENLTISKPSLTTFKIVVDRSPAFKEKIVALNSVSNTTEGPKVTWKKLADSNLQYYYIYRRALNGTKWTRVGKVNSSASSFTDKSVKNKNGKYVYTVKGIDPNGNGTRYHYSGLVSLFAATPIISSVNTAKDNKIQVKWNNTGASYYKVYRKTNGGKWELRASSYRGNTYVDSGMESGNNYQYTVRAVAETSDGTATSAYIGGKSVDYVAAPALGEIAKADEGLNISWEKVNGAVKYSVYRKPLDSSENWTLLKKVSSDETSYNDITADHNAAYAYTVRSEGKTSRGSYGSNGVEYFNLAQPEFTITTDSKGVHVKWDPIPYAEFYQICLKNEKGAWTVIRKTTDCFYDLSVKKCSSYELSVRAARDKARSTYKKDVEPVVYFPSNSVSCQVYTAYNKLAWDYVSADSYNLYKKVKGTDDSLYELIYSGANRSYADKNVEYDVAYSYQVRAVYNSVEQKENLTSTNMTRYSPEKYIESFEAVKSYLKNTAEFDDFPTYSYYFYPTTTKAAEGMKQIVYTKNGNGWVNTRSKYSYTVDADSDTTTGERVFGLMVYDSEGRTPVDGFICSVSKELCSVPRIEYEATKNGLKISWKACDGAVSYQLKESLSGAVDKTVKADGSSKYSVVIPTSSFKLFDTNFSLTAIHSNGNRTTACDSDFRYCTNNPEIHSVQATDNGVMVYFKHAKGFDSMRHRYMIFRKAPGASSWTRVDTIYGDDFDGTSYYWDKTAKPGVKYTYTIRVYDAYNYAYASYYETAGLAVGRLKTPELVSVTNAAGGITVKWGDIYTADKYYVYRKTAKTDWEQIGKVYDIDFEGDSTIKYIDKTAKSGTTYFYTVKAFDGSNSSGYNKTGISVKCLTAPALTSATRSSSGITVKWGKVTGADGYYVYRKTSDSGWSKIGTVKGGSAVAFKDKTAKAGTTYYYTVKAYSGSTTSGYVSKGIKCS